MTELTTAEQAVIDKYRANMRLKHDKWIKELRTHGYTVIEPEPVRPADEEREAALPDTQQSILGALRGLPYSEGGATLAELRRAIVEAGGDDMPRGTSAVAANGLTKKGYVVRRGDRYHLV